MAPLRPKSGRRALFSQGLKADIRYLPNSHAQRAAALAWVMPDPDPEPEPDPDAVYAGRRYGAR